MALTRNTPPSQLSRELRRGESDALARRRAVVCLSLGSAAVMGVIALYQSGVVKRLPDPPLDVFDSNRVNGSSEAYAKLATPDALLGLVSYGVTASLAAAGGMDRDRRRPWLPVLAAGKALFDAGQAAKLTYDQWAKHRAFCVYCLAAAAMTFAALPLSLPEARGVVRRWWRG